jgi:hypothetical protein
MGLISFPNTIPSSGRRILHEIAEELGLYHRSGGQGNQRCIEISSRPFPIIEISNQRYIEVDESLGQNLRASAALADTNGTPDNSAASTKAEDVKESYQSIEAEILEAAGMIELLFDIKSLYCMCVIVSVEYITLIIREISLFQ